MKHEVTEHGKKFGSPLKAIKQYCGDCIGSPRQVDGCMSEECALYAYRSGKNPFSKRQLSPEQKEAASERFKKMWADGKGPRKAKKEAPKKTTAKTTKRGRGKK